jgi:predicted phosphodiesterase
MLDLGVGYHSSMRVLVISDIHANLAALEAVLADAGPYDAAWCLGDLVGYGPNPNECVARVRSLPGLICLLGNHDQAVLGDVDLRVFNSDARAAIRWTQQVVTPETLDYLRSNSPECLWRDYTLVHASPRQPIWEYILDREIAYDNFPFITTPYCLIGHTHQPVIYYQPKPDGEVLEEEPDYAAPRPLARQRLIINPGSVGQPRDNNPDASYALLDVDSEVWEYDRVAYDIAATQARMRAVRLPERLVARLGYGW